MKDIIKKLKSEEKINCKLDSLNLEIWYSRETFKTSIFAIITIICFINASFFAGFFSLLIFVGFFFFDKIRYAKVNKKIFEEYFNVKPKK